MLKITKKHSILILIIFLSSFPTQYRYFIYREIDTKSELESPEFSDILIDDYIIPGITGPLSIDQVIKIGVPDDLNRSGEHTKNGALLAAKEINQAGGIEINASQYYVGISAENTDEQNYNLDLTKAVTATEELLDNDPHFIIGGSRTEALLAYLEIIMDHEIPFIGTGSDTDNLCKKVLNDYDRYKYFYRGMPINETSKFKELLVFILTLQAVLSSPVYLNETVNKIAIIREDLPWTDQWSVWLNSYLPVYTPSLTIVDEIVFPITALMSDFAFYISQIQASGAQILIPLISGVGGILMDLAYNDLKPKFLIAGLNKLAEKGSYWYDSFGMCEFEIVMQNTFRANKTTLTIPFWDAYVNEYGIEPYYTGVGAYDAVRLITHAVNITKSFNPDVIVSALENVNETNPFKGASGNFAFTHSHDLVEGWPYNHYLFCQWQMGGIKKVVPTFGMLYPDILVTGPLLLPPWGINEGGDLPGEFILTSDADNPDINGDFNLSWTISEGAEEYKLYMSDSYISYINPDLDLISHQYDNAPVEMNDLKSGDYFFRVASYNSSGRTLSNCLEINVLRPSPGPFTLTTDTDEPDLDGNFSLSWTSSEGADNYTIYKHSGVITEINETLEILTYQNATSPYEITKTEDGIYYYVVVAVNATGSTLSNSVMVNVTLPPPDHELVVYLEVPYSVKINCSYKINATVQNQGLNDEYDVQLLLYLDGIVVDSTLVPLLPVAGSVTVNYEWKPTNYGNFNFKVYAPPVLGELNLGNNINISLLYVSELFDGLYIKHTLITGGESPVVLHTNYTYRSINSLIYEECFGSDYIGAHLTLTWMVDAQTRIMSGGSSFGDAAHTPAWIFTNTSLYDIIPIAVNGDGDHIFFVTRELTYDLPGLGPVGVWEVEDLLVPGGIAWYEKSTGILLNGTFIPSSMPVYNYTFHFIDTNADLNLLFAPGDFDLSSSAEEPDDDGNFDLTWTESSDANNYSVYVYSSYITVINESLTSLWNERTESNLAITGYSDGIYYFIVVAHNNIGVTSSNCIEITVDIPRPPGNFTLSSNAGNPDDNGNFDLTWTASSDADNYSVYRGSSFITEINGNLTILTDEITDLELALSDYGNGVYYFISVAHNYYGDTLSNCIKVMIQKLIVPGYDPLCIIAILGIVILLIKKKFNIQENP
jgi:branched-chain amino acid transport system substrate-binding protein